MIVAFSISPAVTDDTGGVSEAVAEAVRVVRDSGLPCETNAMFTNVEGEWDEVMAVVKRAVDVVAASSPRVGLVLKADIRPGYDGQLTAKVERISQRLGGEPTGPAQQSPAGWGGRSGRSLGQERLDRAEEHRPGRLVGEQDVVGALQCDEPAVRDQ
jgi:uncharacterized protein YqgV (UPF0045/DUF77 family)